LICNIFKSCWENFEKANRVAGSIFDMSPIFFDASLSTFSAPSQTNQDPKRKRSNQIIPDYRSENKTIDFWVEVGNPGSGSENAAVAPEKLKSELNACGLFEDLSFPHSVPENSCHYVCLCISQCVI